MFGCNADRGHDARAGPGRPVGGRAAPRARRRGGRLVGCARCACIADAGWRSARLPHTDQARRDLLGAPAAAWLCAGAGAGRGRRGRWPGRLPAAARCRQDGRLLPQPASQHRLAAPPAARSAAGDRAVGCRRTRDRRGRLGAHQDRARGGGGSRQGWCRASPPAPCSASTAGGSRGPPAAPTMRAIRSPPTSTASSTPRAPIPSAALFPCAARGAR